MTLYSKSINVKWQFAFIVHSVYCRILKILSVIYDVVLMHDIADQFSDINSLKSEKLEIRHHNWNQLNVIS